MRVILSTLVVLSLSLLSLVSGQGTTGINNNGCANATITTRVMAVTNECSALNNITGLASFCSQTANQGDTILNNNNNINYVISCPPANGVDTATGIFVQPGGTITITAFTAFTPSDFSNLTVNDFWCSGFESQITGQLDTALNPRIDGGSCAVAPGPNDTPNTCNGNNLPPLSPHDFRVAGAGGSTAAQYCSFAGGEDHVLALPTFQSYSSPAQQALYHAPANFIAQGAMVYRIGLNNPSGGGAYNPLFTGIGQVGARLDAGLNNRYVGYSGGNVPAVNVPIGNTAGPTGRALVRSLTIPAGVTGQFYLCFWDYYNADNHGNIHVAITYTAPRGASACVNGDPQFTGLRGQSFQVHGIDGAIYNLITDASIQVNSRFVFLDNGECPYVEGVKGENCWSHPGSYLGEIAIQQIVNGVTHELHLISGPAATGFTSVTYNGDLLQTSDFVFATESGAKEGNVVFSARMVNPWEVEVLTPQFSFTFYNSDMFINQALRVQTPAIKSLRAHGLLGQTWSTKTYKNDLKYIEGEVDDYSLPSDDILGTDFVFNKFPAKSQ